MYRTILLTIAMLTIVLSVFANAATPDYGRTLIVQLQGRATGETRTIPPLDPTKTATTGNCFDADLTDAMTGNSIGTATRCFTDITTVNGSTALTDTTFFHLRDGTIVSQSRTTVTPAFDSSPDVVHIATAIPAPSATTILPDAGNGGFRGVPGTVRLAGAMDLSQFRTRNEIGFNDIYIIRLAERPQRLTERPAAMVDNQARIREVQRQLQGEGFAPGRVDGVLGPQTRVALREYQAKHGLPRTGELDEATSRALGVY
jgi:hypothetical protein